jgi:YYY domain-containing protein
MLSEIIIWYALITAIGIVALPIVSMVCKNLTDQGYCISKTAGILMLTYLTWMLSYQFSFSRSTVLMAGSILCVISLLCAMKNRPQITKEIVIRNEALFFVVFVVFLVIRAYNPEITTFGEKFMDFAFLNAIMRTSQFPPYDPWLAGESINFYYYFGYLIVAVLSKLSGISTAITYNLGLVTFSALAANAAFGVGHNLTRNVRYGLLTMLFVVFIANSYIVFNVAAGLLHLPVASHEQVFGLWASTRVIPATINEFPYFSFIFGDLHPHVISIPFQLLALLLILNIYRSKSGGMRMYGESRACILAGMLLLALCIGAFFTVNAWDYPVYLVLFATVALAQQYRTACLKDAILPVAIVAILSIVLFAPFYLDFQGTGASGIGIVHQNTLLINFIEIFALFIFLIFSFLISHLNLDKRYVIALLPVILLSLIFFQILLVIVPLILLCIYLLSDQASSSQDTMDNRFVLILVLTGALLALFCEIFYLNDCLGAPNERMNTVFKLYLQIWILWGIAAGYSVYSIYSRYFAQPAYSTQPIRSTEPPSERSGSRISDSWIKSIWTVIFCILIVSCCIYLFTGTCSKITLDHNPPTLDGIEYLNESERGEYLVILWIRSNIAGTPVILEAPGRSYSTGSRISAFTGLPTVIGWQGHERMWRKDYDGVRLRTGDVDAIYSTPNINYAIGLLNKYNVTYIYIGTTERARYGRGSDKFEDEDYFECVYIGSTRIYKLKGSQDGDHDGREAINGTHGNRHTRV